MTSSARGPTERAVPSMRVQIAAGADGIITDYPSRLRAVMKELGMPLPRSYRTR